MAHYRSWLLARVAQWLPWFVLFLLVIFLYAKLFVVPYAGFRLASSGEITAIFADDPAVLQVGDLIRQIDRVEWEQHRRNRWQWLFPEPAAGSILNLTVQRGDEGELVEVQWPMAGLTTRELVERLNSQWWLAFLFWAAGTAAWIFIRPRGQLWALFLLFNYLTALWIITGGVALWKVWLSQFVFRSTLWLCLPVYLHFHWNFPTPLRPVRPVVWAIIYAITIAGAAGEWLNLWPLTAYYLPFLIALLGMILILVFRFWRRPAERSEIRLLFFTALFGFIPPIIIGVLGFLGINWPFYLEGGAILAFAAIPGAYFFTFHLQQHGQLQGRAGRLLRFYVILVLVGLGSLLLITTTADWAGVFDSIAVISFALALLVLLAGLIGLAPIVLLAALGDLPGRAGRSMELRADRRAAAFFFFPLLVTVAALPVFGAYAVFNSAGAAGVVGLLTVLVAAVVTRNSYGSFERFVEQRVLGMPLPPAGLVERYADRIATSLNRHSLIGLLREEILPTLLVRQSALLFWDENRPPTLLYSQGLGANFRVAAADFAHLFAQAGHYWPEGIGRGYGWVRLVLPMSVNQKPFGLWLFGRRDPDDLYGPAEIPTLQTLANQTAVALVNILQGENLQLLYRANIQREEKERLKLAHELHDDVLNEMAAMLIHLEQTPPAFEQAHDRLVDRLRGLIRGLRPPMLDWGLYAALDSLVDDLMERADGQVAIHFDVPETEVRYDPQVEKNLFRIVHQAAENALRHAEPRTIRIGGQLQLQQVSLEVTDDGKGFGIGERPELATLLAGEHYGLAGMQERAALIGAKMAIHSVPGEGSRVSLLWQLDGRHE